MKPDVDECGRWMISIKEILTKRRKTTTVEHGCLQGEYEDQFWQFSAHQSFIYQIKHIIKTF